LINGVAHSRSPAVPFVSPVALADALFFVGDDAGDVTAFNTQTGQVGWGPTLLSSTMVTGAPGGFFVQYGGPADAILVGTRNTSAGPSKFYSLNLSTGVELPPAFDGTTGFPGLGPIMSTPTLDYATGRAYITSWRFTAPAPSAWCVQIKPDGTIDPTPVWARAGLGDISASPVTSNGRVYVANTTGDIYSLSKVDGTPGPVYPTGDGAVKGFLFPNRATGELFFATDTMVHSISDDGSGNLTLNWSWDAGGTLDPSLVLHWPNTDFLYVGSKDGTLWQIDFSLAPVLSATSQILGDGVGHIGAPSLDIGLVPPDVSALGNALLLVGSESGALYAVEVPLP
jgi:outer membrane protein assembly factor BamB